MARNLNEPGANFNQLLELSIKLQNARTFASKPKPNGVTTITSDDWLETIDPGGWATEDEEELNAGGRVGYQAGDLVPKAKPKDYLTFLIATMCLNLKNNSFHLKNDTPYFFTY